MAPSTYTPKTAPSHSKTSHFHPCIRKLMLNSALASWISIRSSLPLVCLGSPPRTRSSPLWCCTWDLCGTWRDSWSSYWQPRKQSTSWRLQSGILTTCMSSLMYNICTGNYYTPAWWYEQEGPISQQWKPCSEFAVIVCSCHIMQSNTLKKNSTGRRSSPSPSSDAPSPNLQPSLTFVPSQT